MSGMQVGATTTPNGRQTVYKWILELKLRLQFRQQPQLHSYHVFSSHHTRSLCSSSFLAATTVQASALTRKLLQVQYWYILETQNCAWLASYPGSPLAPTKNKNGGENVGKRLVVLLLFFFLWSKCFVQYCRLVKITHAIPPRHYWL